MTPIPQIVLGWAAPVLIVLGVVSAAVSRHSDVFATAAASLGVVCLIAWAVTASITGKLDELIAAATEDEGPS